MFDWAQIHHLIKFKTKLNLKKKKKKKVLSVYDKIVKRNLQTFFF